MKCKHCGEEIANDSLFCEHCGTETGRKNNFHAITRWCLLLAMSCSVYALWEVNFIERQGLREDLGLGMSIIPIVLFVYTVVGGLKKLFPVSFVIIMTLGFLTNTVLLYLAVSPNEAERVEVVISTNDNNYPYENCSIQGETIFFHDHEPHDTKKERDRLEGYASSLCQELNKKNNLGWHISVVSDNTICYWKFKPVFVFYYLIFVLPLYLTYTIVARIKKLKF